MRTTHIGSLPFIDEQEALEFTFQFDLPVLFTLPNKNFQDRMDQEILFLRDQLIPTHWNLFRDGLESRGKKYFKYQLMGPVTARKVLDLDLDVTFYQKILQPLEGLYLFHFDEPAMSSDGEYVESRRVLNQLKSCFPQVKMGFHLCQKIACTSMAMVDEPYNHLDGSLYTSQELSQLANIKMISLGGQWRVQGIDWIAPACGLANAKNPYEVLKALEQFNLSPSRPT